MGFEAEGREAFESARRSSFFLPHAYLVEDRERRPDQVSREEKEEKLGKMFGSSGKFGRGGGGGRGGGPPKRGGLHNPFPPPQPSAQRLSGPPRAPIGAASRRMQGGPGPGSAPPPATEETFSLVSKFPLSFGMIIRLTPDLVEEIRRVEAQGGTARIKFDSNANNVSGNVIEVGGKDFSFQWSSELGDCDIYEENVGGEDGNGLLVESGSAWRKLNVQRVLDENIKNHVKMRSEEAERKLKSRKAIVLDPANPSVKNQAKTMAAASVESNMRRMPFKPKKEPAFKKRKVEPNPGPSKSVFKSGTSIISTAKNRLSVSPLPSTPEQPVAASSPFAVGNSTSAPKPKVINREDATNSEREIPNRAFHLAAGEASRNKHSGSTSMDLRNALITLLMGKPQGMDFQAIEKAVGDKHPDSRMDIEAVIKKVSAGNVSNLFKLMQIAHYQYPGKYILNPRVEIESVKKPSSESGSSPECTDGQTPVAEASSLEKTGAGEFEQHTQLNLNMGEEPNLMENIDIQSTSPDLFATDKKMNNNSEGGGSSSESGSDSESSDSDSSDSGSESGSQSKSRSRSRSPAGSGSASSSDSESDGSSSSKEGFDDDVDIMVSDDDDRVAAENKLQASEPLLITSPKTFRDGHTHDGMDITEEGDRIQSSALDLNDVGKYDDMSDEVDIDDLPNDNSVKIYENHETEEGESTDWLPQAANSRSPEEEMPLSPGEHKPFDNERVSNFGIVFNEISGNAIKQRSGVMQSSAKDNLDYEHHESNEKVSRPKSKRASDPNRFQEKSESAKKLKEKKTMADKVERDENAYAPAEPARFLAYEIANRSQSNSDFVNSLFTDVQQPTQRGDDHKARDKLPAITDRPSKCVENLSRNSKNLERFSALPDESDNSVLRGNHLQDKLPVPKDKLHNEREDEDNNAFEKSFMRNESESGIGDRLSTLPDSHYRKSGKISGKGKDGVYAAHVHTASLNKENSKPDTKRDNTLRREPSDLELGEFREPVPEEIQGSKKQFERKSSFKSVENKSNTTDNLHSDSNKGRPVGKAVQELKRQSPIHSDNQDRFYQRNVLEDDFEDSVRYQQRTVPAVTKQFPRLDHVDPEAGSQWDRLSDVAGKAKKNGGKKNQGTGLEGHADATRNSKNGCPVVSSNSKETKQQKSNPLTDLVERKDNFCFENNTNGRNKRESSSDEDDSFYLKYDKDEPELKGVIQDHAQYKEYVKEYREKYDLYCSLNGTLENYRNDFEKLGCELNLAKGKDTERYYVILEQISENYRQCIPKVKRMKKVFIVLHEELKQLSTKEEYLPFYHAMRHCKGDAEMVDRKCCDASREERITIGTGFSVTDLLGLVLSWTLGAVSMNSSQRRQEMSWWGRNHCNGLDNHPDEPGYATSKIGVYVKLQVLMGVESL
ncbi:hypothetical protein ACLOJK_010325 [Asimina triloba]